MELVIIGRMKLKSFWQMLTIAINQTNGKLLVFDLRRMHKGQNPVEDVWLQAKNFLRKFWPLCKSFSVVKWLFKFFTNHQEFDFPLAALLLNPVRISNRIAIAIALLTSPSRHLLPSVKEDTTILCQRENVSSTVFSVVGTNIVGLNWVRFSSNQFIRVC